MVTSLLTGCASHRPVLAHKDIVVYFEGVVENKCTIDHITLDSKTGAYTVHCKGTQSD